MKKVTKSSRITVLERQLTVSKLKKANFDRSDIVKVKGHRSVRSLDDYDEADKEEQRRLSSAISNSRISDITTIVAPLAPVNTNVPAPHTLAAP